MGYAFRQVKDSLKITSILPLLSFPRPPEADRKCLPPEADCLRQLAEKLASRLVPAQAGIH